MTRPPPEWHALLDLTAPEPRMPPEGLDGERLVRLAAGHRVLFALRSGIERTGYVLPGAAGERLGDALDRAAMRSLAATGATVRISRALDAAGCAPLILKGEPLGVMIHGRTGQRDPGDLDVMVPQERLGAAAEALGALGYGCAYAALLSAPRQRGRLEGAVNQLEFVPAEGRGAVELHWRWKGPDWAFPLDGARAWPGRQVALGGARVRVPDTADHVLFLCVHGIAHEWRRLKWLNDLRHILAAPSCLGLPWEALCERARERALTRALAAAALQVASVDPVALPGPVRDLTARVPEAARLHARIEPLMERMAADPDDPARLRRPFATADRLLHLHRLQDAPGISFARAAWQVATAFSPADLIRADLPTGMGWAYLPMRAARHARQMASGRG